MDRRKERFDLITKTRNAFFSDESKTTEEKNELLKKLMKIAYDGHLFGCSNHIDSCDCGIGEAIYLCVDLIDAGIGVDLMHILKQVFLCTVCEKAFVFKKTICFPYRGGNSLDVGGFDPNLYTNTWIEGGMLLKVEDDPAWHFDGTDADLCGDIQKNGICDGCLTDNKTVLALKRFLEKKNEED